MKKLSLLAGTLGTTAAWYVLSNKKLRNELAQAETPEQTVTILRKYLGRDAEKIAKEVHELIRSEEVQSKVTGAKKFTGEKLSKAKEGLGSWLQKGKKLKEDAMKKIQGGT